MKIQKAENGLALYAAVSISFSHKPVSSGTLFIQLQARIISLTISFSPSARMKKTICG
jgi:hypothetical protein